MSISYKLRNSAFLNQNHTSRLSVFSSSLTAKLRVTSMQMTSKIFWNKIKYSTISNLLPDQGLLKYPPSQTCQSSGLTFGIIRAVTKLSVSSTGASTSAGISLLLEGQTWTRVSPNAKTAGSGDMLPSLAESKVPSVSSAMDHTDQKTTKNLGSAAKRMKRRIPLVSRQRKATYVLIHSSVLIAGAITKLTPTSAHSEDIDSIESSTKRNMLKSVKTESNWFTLWRTTSSKYDLG